MKTSYTDVANEEDPNAGEKKNIKNELPHC
jgi:hypothetical protein